MTKPKPVAPLGALGNFMVCVIRQNHTFDAKKICSVCGASEGSPTLLDILAESVATKLAERAAKKGDGKAK